MNGRVHSVESLGTVDGPGVRSVVFLSGCPLRCICCHNPDTWDGKGGEEISHLALAERLLRFRSYYGESGGVTVSGGEPLMQAGFTADLFTVLKQKGVHTALDTSGALPDGREVPRLLDVTDLVLLDIKYTDEDEYFRNTGCRMKTVLRFLDELERRGIPVWIRQVIIPGINDGKEQIKRLAMLLSRYSVVQRAELLPFRKLCIAKYQALGIPFPLAETPEADADAVHRLEEILNRERIQ